MDATAWDERYSGPGLVWSPRASRWLMAEMAGAVPGRALDLATGEGRNAIWLAEQGWSVIAVDFSQVGLDRAADRAAHAGEQRQEPLDITWICADVTSMDIPTEEYDLVLLSYVQLPDYERTPLVRSCAAALTSGGVLLVIGHDSSNLGEGYGGPQDASVLYTALDLEKDLQDAIRSGWLVLESSGRVARDVETDEGTRYAWDALLKARRKDTTKVTFSLG